MSNLPQPDKRHRMSLDVAPGFEMKVRLLAAKWGVKTNVAVQRAVELAGSRSWPPEEKEMLQTMSARIEEIARYIVPP